MGRYYSTAIVLITITCFFLSCAFDPPEAELIELGKGYYISDSTNNEGIKIIYSFKQNLYQVVASNCLNIYSDSNFIAFDKNTILNDTVNYEYYFLNKNSKTELKKISKAKFNDIIEKLEKIEIKK